MNILEMNGICKTFGSLKALDDVSISLARHEVRGLMGINGAGKSTLMKILSGIYQADAGEVNIDGEQVEIPNPEAAQRLGVAIVHQEFSLIPHLSVSENLSISRLPVTDRFTRRLDRSLMDKQAQEVLDLVGIDIDIHANVSELSIGKQQMVEIAKAIALKDPKIIIFDEPTSALSSGEIEKLFSVIRRLKRTQIGIIYITHRLGEFEEICDSTTILRDGRLIGTFAKGQKSLKQMIDMMLGTSGLSHERGASLVDLSHQVLRLQDLSGERFPGPVNCTLHRGEILGLVGQMGSGRSEVLRTIMNIDSQTSGSITLNGQELKGSVDSRIAQGIGFVAEDRKREGLLPTRVIRENTTISVLHQLCPFGVVDRKKEQSLYDATARQTELSPNDPDLLITRLSGGNQQKVMIGRWLGLQNLKVLLLDEPTRGVDVGAKYQIYTILRELAARGISILVASSDLEEILIICDRIIHLDHGRSARERQTNTLDLTSLTLLISEEGIIEQSEKGNHHE